MSVMNPLAVVPQYFPFDDFMFTYNVPSTVTVADEGKAVILDTAAENQMKLTAVNDTVMGRIFKVEDRRQQGGGVVATIERKFRAKLPYTGTAPTVGQQVEGSATAGVVQATASQPAIGARSNRVIAVDTTNLVCVVEYF